MLTLIIHGTFARDESWWRLASDGTSFASQLEAAMSKQGIQGSVWKPALDSGFSYADFSWSHANWHADRRRGARSLARTLAKLAQARGATRESPLEVNLVAHSHGGNVVLDALRNLDHRVRARRVVLLGTPLISAKPALRIVRFVIALLLVSFVAIIPLIAIGAIISSEGSFALLGGFALIIVFNGWVFWGWAWFVDMVTRLVAWPISQLRGRGAGQVYGPPPQVLPRVVANGKIVLFTTHDDEADLALQLSAAPKRLYAELVKVKLGPVGRILEAILIRPLIVGMVLDVLEAVLERYVMGFPWWRILFIDYEMADLKKGRAYPPSLVERVDVSNELLPEIRRTEAAMAVAAPLAVDTPQVVLNAERRVRTLYEKLALVVQNLRAQLRLRHSVYHQAESVVQRVADILVKP